MKFHVGPHTYTVRIMENPIVWRGRPRNAIIREKRHVIEICPTVAARLRLPVLAHEIAHAQVYATGQPKGLEHVCNFVATVTAQLLRDLRACGGEEALIRLRPGESPAAGACRIPLNQNRCCGICRQTIAAGSITCEPSSVPGYADMALYCDYCGQTQRWREMLTAHGYPNCQIEGQPTFEPGNTTGVSAELGLIYSGHEFNSA